jgi:hypothetical protein
MGVDSGSADGDERPFGRGDRPDRGAGA